MESIVAVCVSIAVSALLFGLEDICLSFSSGYSYLGCTVSGGGEVLEDMTRVEELGVDVLWSEKITADDEDFRRYVTEQRTLAVWKHD